MVMVEPIAAVYRGTKGIPFEDLIAEGGVGLVKAAREWRPPGSFPDYAAVAVHNQIKSFIGDWEEYVSLDDSSNPSVRIYEWDLYKRSPLAIPLEVWDSLPTTPEEILSGYEEIKNREKELRTAISFLSKPDRWMIEARFLREPPLKLEDIAREAGISYWQTLRRLKKIIKTLKSVVDSQVARDNSGADKKRRAA